jgi:hypothetical protein
VSVIEVNLQRPEAFLPFRRAGLTSSDLGMSTEHFLLNMIRETTEMDGQPFE